MSLHAWQTTFKFAQHVSLGWWRLGSHAVILPRCTDSHGTLELLRHGGANILGLAVFCQ